MTRSRGCRLAAIPLVVVAALGIWAPAIAAEEVSSPAETAPSPATEPATSPQEPSSAEEPSSTAPEAPADGAVPSPDADAPAPTEQQRVDIQSTGVAVADTGGNVSAPGSAADPVPGDGSSTAVVTAGSATAVGGASASSIAQTASAVVDGDAKVLISQLALVVNVGLALAESGANLAIAGSPPGGGGAAIVRTGNASAAGLIADTTVTQVVQLLDADEATSQSTTVVNIGVGSANTGGNLAIMGPANGSTRTAVAVDWSTPAGDAAVGTGSASAVGNRSTSTIVQVAVAVASGDGVIRITQRAVVVNFGAAFAETGVNGAGGASDGEVAVLARAVLAGLLSALVGNGSLGISLGDGAFVGATGAGSASITTGNSVAVGSQSRTAIVQQASGNVTGNHEASSTQAASVGNFGVATANTGGNAAGAADGDTAAPPPNPAVQAVVTGLLRLLAGPIGEESWTTTLGIGADLVRVFSDRSLLEATSVVGGSGGPGSAVAIRQVTGVLNLMFALASSGGNVSGTTTNQTEGTPAGERSGLATTLEAPVGLASGASRSAVSTGDAVAVGSHAVVRVCQVIDTSPTVCDPAAAVGAGAAQLRPPLVFAVSAPAQAGAAAGNTLAFTGGPFGLQLAVGGALLALGLLLVVAARRVRSA